MDRDALAYGMAWPLQDDRVAADAAWLVAEALRPLVLHVATPCTDNCVIGKQEVSPHTDKLIELSAELLLHQEAHRYLGSLEQPVGSLLATKPTWVKAFKTGRPDGCLREPWHQ